MANKRLIGIRELSELTGFSISTLYTWVNQRKIPYAKFGYSIRFDLQKIEFWIKENTVKEFKLKEI